MALFSVDEMSQEWGLQAPFCGSAICAAPALLCTANGTRGGGWRVQRLGWEAECSPPGLLSGVIIKIGIPIDIGILQKNGIMNKIGILNICISSTRQRGLCMIVSHLKTWSQPTAAHSGKFHRKNSEVILARKQLILFASYWSGVGNCPILGILDITL